MSYYQICLPITLLQAWMPSCFFKNTKVLVDIFGDYENQRWFRGSACTLHKPVLLHRFYTTLMLVTTASSSRLIVMGGGSNFRTWISSYSSLSKTCFSIQSLLMNIRVFWRVARPQALAHLDRGLSISSTQAQALPTLVIQLNKGTVNHHILLELKKQMLWVLEATSIAKDMRTISYVFDKLRPLVASCNRQTSSLIS